MPVEGALPSSPFASSTAVPVYLEWNDLAVTLKSKEEKKPPHIEIATRKLEDNKRDDSPLFQLLPQVPPCSTATPPTLSSESIDSHYKSPTSSVSPQILHALSRQPPQWPSPRPILQPNLSYHQQQQAAHQSLPSPPEFSFLRPHVPFDMPRPAASEPLCMSSERPAVHQRQESKDEIEAPSDKTMNSKPNDQLEEELPPLQVYHSPESAAARLRKETEPRLLNPTPLPPAPAIVEPPLSVPQQPQPSNAKFILAPLSGYALPGQLTVIMGGSGAGKTTLLNVLAGRHSSSTARLGKQSRIEMNGEEIPYAQLSAKSAAVQQNDLLLPCLTVREILDFAAVMKLPRTYSAEKRRQRVNQVIQGLGLQKCQNFLVGSSGEGDDVDSSSGGGGGGGSNDQPSDGAPSEDAAASAGAVASGPSNAGVARSGISGGEQRRLSIGMELVSDPQVLFLDEPTSGLDSTTAYTIIHLLKRLAVSRGRTIILTIHSPSSKIFSLFDRLILLAPSLDGSGAKVAYSGPANQVVDWFTSLGFSPKELVKQRAASLGGLVPEESASSMTISDFLMLVLDRRTEKGLKAELQARGEDQAAENAAIHGDHSQPLSANLAASSDALIASAIAADDARLSIILSAYAAKPDVIPEHIRLPSNHERVRQQHEIEREERKEPDALSPSSALKPSQNVQPFHPGSVESISWLAQLQHLTRRTYLTHIRSVSLLKARIFTNLFLGLFVGLLYLSPSQDPASKTFNQASIFNRVGFIFFVTCMQALITLVNAVLTFTEERGLFLRESSNRMYSPSAYFLSKMLVELPMNTALSCLFGAIGYAMVGMNPEPNHAVKFLFLLSLLGHAVSSIGLLLGSLVHVPIIATMLCPITVIPFMLTSGFFINISTMPPYLSWLMVISSHRYLFSGLMGLEFADLQTHCDPGEMRTMLLQPDSSAPQPMTYCSMINGRQVLQLLSLPADEYWSDVGALILLSVCFRLLAFIVLYASVRENRLKLKALRKKTIKTVLVFAKATITACRQRLS